MKILHCQYDGIEALDTVFENTFDLLLLDVGTPSISGFELLEELRKRKNHTPTIFITSLNDVKSLEKAFKIGCDDYIKKPFDLKELEVRINHIKVVKQIDKNDIIIINEQYNYDYENTLIIRDNTKINLSQKESKILEYFLKNKNRTISFEELTNNIWQYDTIPTNATIRTYIKNLRKILGENMITTIKGLGYKFES